jgi:hypothetical protein
MVKRAIANVVGSSSFEFNEAAYDIDDIDPILYFLYGLLGYQNMEPNCKNNFFPEPKQDRHSLAHERT